jgi:carbon storage regulator
MLILTRKKDEAIRIGESILVRVVEIDKNTVKLGIEAPREIEILREELIQAVSEENLKAAQGTTDALLNSLSARLKKA